MSFFHTQAQFTAGTKDVTRRRGWSNLKPGDRFMAVLKGQGLKRGERVTRLGECVCVSNRRERLDAIDAADCRREGFPELTPAEFVAMFCRHMGGEPDQEVSRIQFLQLRRPLSGFRMLIRNLRTGQPGRLAINRLRTPVKS